MVSVPPARSPVRVVMLAEPFVLTEPVSAMSVVGATQAEDESVWKMPLGAVDDPERAPERSGKMLAEEAVEENCQFPKARLAPLDEVELSEEQPESRADVARTRPVHTAMKDVRGLKDIESPEAIGRYFSLHMSYIDTPEKDMRR